jgi:hypothetical protein
VLEPSQFIRFPVPIPNDGLRSDVVIKATFCVFTPVDPEDSLNYTRVGLGIVFRRSTVGDFGFTKDGKPRGIHPGAGFFRPMNYYSTEMERRRDAHKWEPVLKDQIRFANGTLNQPAFDVEHHAVLTVTLRRNPMSRGQDFRLTHYHLVALLDAVADLDLRPKVANFGDLASDEAPCPMSSQKSAIAPRFVKRRGA